MSQKSVRRPDPLEVEARELCLATGVDPDSRIVKTDSPRGQPAWCSFRDAARAALNAREQADLALQIVNQKDRFQADLALQIVNLRPQEDRFQNAPMKVFGEHDAATITQMRNCMAIGNVVSGVICADGHLGYAQPVGGVIAYEKQISISGVGFDIACGNMAVRLDTPYSAVRDRARTILTDIQKVISFGVGRTNSKRVEHELFDDSEVWKEADMEAYRTKAVSQLGTVGSGNHYVDLMVERPIGFSSEHPLDTPYWDNQPVWIGVHFGSRGLGHTGATRYMKAAGGKDGMNVAPAVIDEDSELGRRYIAMLGLGGRYSYAGREDVIETVRQIIGGSVTEMVHNHHNYAWRETHDDRDLWVVRKGATPAFPGQKGFVGGSMGDDAVIIEGIDSPEAKASLYSTVHGAGRLFGRKQAIRTFTPTQMNDWLRNREVLLAGGGLDESPMAYRRLPEVLKHHNSSIKVLHTLRPFAVAMAGEAEYDPWKD